MARLLNRTAHRTVDAIAEPVSLEEAKAAIGIAECTTGHNGRIRSLIKAARTKFEKDTRLALISQTWVTKFTDHPTNPDDPFELPRPPLRSVSSVVYQATTSGTSTWNSSNYILDTVSYPGAIYKRDSVNWPEALDYPTFSWTITSIHGFSTDSDGVPEDAKVAVLALVDDWFCQTGVDGPANTWKYDSIVSTLRWGDYR